MDISAKVMKSQLTKNRLAKSVNTEFSYLDMDKHGPDDIDTMRKARVRAEMAAKEKGKKMKDKPTREYLLLAQLRSSLRLEDTEVGGHSRLLNNTITSEHPPCDTGLKDLQPILIKDLRAELIHGGRYIVLRTISVPLRQFPLILVAEDHNGDATMVTLFNMNIDGGDDQRFMPVNTYLVIRTPFYKKSGMELYAIRVDHPSDCIRMSAGNAFVNQVSWARPEYHARHVETNVEKLKAEGGRYFAASNFQAALDLYNTALEQIALEPQCEMWRKLFCNRAVTQLKIGRFEAVLSDTTFLLPIYPDTRRPLFLQARAYYSLRDFKAARKAWEAYLSFAPNDKDGQKHMKMTRTRLDEETNGNYNLKRMFTDATMAKFPRLDYADYLAAVEIKDSKLVKGQRGLFARQDFKQGELVFCEKAFRICYKDEITNQTTINTVKNRFNKGPDARLPSMITQALFDNPSLAPRFLDLYCRRKPIGGDPTPRRIDGDPLIDAFTVASIVECNAFKVDKPPRCEHERAEKDKALGHDTGIWIQASYINHSCVGNISRAFVGDMMLVRAQRSIKKGDELLHTYVPPSSNIELKKKAFRSLGFTCKCEVCKAQNVVTEEEQKRRDGVLVLFDGMLDHMIDSRGLPTQSLVNELQTVIKKILETYTTNDYCFDVLKPYEMLFGMKYYLQKHSECIKDLREMLRNVSGTDIGDSDFDSFEPRVWTHDLISILLQFYLVFQDMGDKVRAEKCRKIIRVLHGNMTGLGVEFSRFDAIVRAFRSFPPH